VDRVAAGDQRAEMSAGAERYERFASAGPMQIASSASIGASDSRSASEYATTASMPSVRQGAQDAEGDLAAVGDQDPVDHRQASPPGPAPSVASVDASGSGTAATTAISSPYSTASPGWANTSTSVPSMGP
jgi:hypothetical protein